MVWYNIVTKILNYGEYYELCVQQLEWCLEVYSA